MIKTRREKWYADQTNLQKLSAILNDPVMQAAMAVLEEDKRPKPDSTERPSADAITKAAMRHENLVGFFEYHDALLDLAGNEPAGPQGAPDAYSDEYVEQEAAKRGYELPPKE